MPSSNGLTAYSLVDQKTKAKLRLEPENILGRESGLKTETMSRRHCQIVTKENRWFLADLDSTNGTFLNGKKMKPREWYSLKVGDEVEFGSMVFNFAGPRSKNEANIEAPRADTVSIVEPRDGEATSRHKVPVVESAQAPAPASAVELPSLGVRFLAFLIDTSLSILILFALFLLIQRSSRTIFFEATIALTLVIWAPMFLRSQSLGKMAMGLKVVRNASTPMGIGRLMLREIVLKFLSFYVSLLVFVYLFKISLLTLLATVLFYVAIFLLYRWQGAVFWDLVLKTRVVKDQNE